MKYVDLEMKNISKIIKINNDAFIEERKNIFQFLIDKIDQNKEYIDVSQEEYDRYFSLLTNEIKKYYYANRGIPENENLRFRGYELKVQDD